MNNSDKNQVIDLMWTIEEETTPAGSDPVEIEEPGGSGGSGGGVKVGCCCSIPSILTKWVCPN